MTDDQRDNNGFPPNAKRVFKGKVFEIWQWEQKLFDGSTATFEEALRPDTVEVIAVADGRIIIEEQEQPGLENLSHNPSARDTSQLPQDQGARTKVCLTHSESEATQGLRKLAISHAGCGSFSAPRCCDKVAVPRHSSLAAPCGCGKTACNAGGRDCGIGSGKFLSLPGGKADGGASPEEEIKRELLEETGYASDDWEPWKTVHPFLRQPYAIHYFVARDCKKIREPHLDAGERIALRFVSFDELLMLSDDPNFRGTEFVKILLRMRLDKHMREEFRKKLGI